MREATDTSNVDLSLPGVGLLPIPSERQQDHELCAGKLCSQTCPVPYGNNPNPPACGKPCRGWAGHEGQHQCNRHHTW